MPLVVCALFFLKYHSATPVLCSLMKGFGAYHIMMWSLPCLGDWEKSTQLHAENSALVWSTPSCTHTTYNSRERDTIWWAPMQAKICMPRYGGCVIATKWLSVPMRWTTPTWIVLAGQLDEWQHLLFCTIHNHISSDTQYNRQTHHHGFNEASCSSN